VSARKSANRGVAAEQSARAAAASGNSTPFASLTPDAVLDAAAALGLAPDGRLFALNSYENRVYRVGRIDEEPVVLKFYRAGRWSDQQILEEHGFATELAAEEILVPRRCCWPAARCIGTANFAWPHFHCVPAPPRSSTSRVRASCSGARSLASMRSGRAGDSSTGRRSRAHCSARVRAPACCARR